MDFAELYAIMIVPNGVVSHFAAFNLKIYWVWCRGPVANQIVVSSNSNVVDVTGEDILQGLQIESELKLDGALF